jgi:hypothetical protein
MSQAGSCLQIDLESSGHAHRCASRADADPAARLEQVFLAESRARQARVRELMRMVAREMARESAGQPRLWVKRASQVA